MRYFRSIEFLLFHDYTVGQRLVWSLVFFILFLPFSPFILIIIYGFNYDANGLTFVSTEYCSVMLT